LKTFAILSILALAGVASADAVTAFWTGNAHYGVTTVSYQIGVECEYNANGNLFWETFIGGSCPANVEVQ